MIGGSETVREFHDGFDSFIYHSIVDFFVSLCRM